MNPLLLPIVKALTADDLTTDDLPLFWHLLDAVRLGVIDRLRAVGAVDEAVQLEGLSLLTSTATTDALSALKSAQGGHDSVRLLYLAALQAIEAEENPRFFLVSATTLGSAVKKAECADRVRWIVLDGLRPKSAPAAEPTDHLTPRLRAALEQDGALAGLVLDAFRGVEDDISNRLSSTYAAPIRGIDPMKDDPQGVIDKLLKLEGTLATFSEIYSSERGVARLRPLVVEARAPISDLDEVARALRETFSSHGARHRLLRRLDMLVPIKVAARAPQAD